jgi:ketosteroid isomerase-like protein
MTFRSLLACSVLLLASACASRRIPGTEIPDTKDTRAIINVMERYRSALEARDAKAIQALVSKDFREDGGTDSLEDDLTAENLGQHLTHLFERMEAPRVELNIRRVEVRENDLATAIYYWNANWRLPGLNARPQNDSELEQMVLRKEDGQWKILSGI